MTCEFKLIQYNLCTHLTYLHIILQTIKTICTKIQKYTCSQKDRHNTKLLSKIHWDNTKAHIDKGNHALMLNHDVKI